MDGTRRSTDGPSIDAAIGPTAAGGGITVERIAGLQSFLDLESEWADLLKRSEANRAFLTHQWFRCWWEAFGGDGQLFVLCARRDDRLVGVAPLYSTRARFRGLPARELRFLANDYSEECDFITDQAEPGVLQSLLVHLARAHNEWDLLRLERIRQDSSLWRHRAAILDQAGLRYRELSGLRTPFMHISGNWADFLAGQSKKFRKTYRNRVNAMTRQPEPVQVKRHVAATDVIGALDSVFAVSSNSWKASEGRAITSSRGASRLFEALSEQVAEKGWVTLWLATVGGKPVAFEYHLTYEGVTSPIRADFDEAYRGVSPGAYLEAEIYRNVFDHPDWDIAEYNSCADSYEYALRWTKTVHEHAALLVPAPGWYGTTLGFLGRLRRLRFAGRKTIGAGHAK